MESASAFDQSLIEAATMTKILQIEEGVLKQIMDASSDGEIEIYRDKGGMDEDWYVTAKHDGEAVTVYSSELSLALDQLLYRLKNRQAQTKEQAK